MEKEKGDEKSVGTPSSRPRAMAECIGDPTQAIRLDMGESGPPMPMLIGDSGNAPGNICACPNRKRNNNTAIPRHATRHSAVGRCAQCV